MRVTWIVAWLAAVGGLVGACSSKSTRKQVTEPCEAGVATTCAGEDGCIGLRQCLGDGSYGPCTCSDAGTGGSSGTGGSPSGGTGGATGGAGGATTTSNLGARCNNSSDCGGLTCITAASGKLDGAGPAGGICTLDCSLDPGACTAHDGHCVAFGGDAFCMQACSIGDESADKCHGRLDMACTETSTTSCQPRCGSDAQCGSGLSCDPSTGLCVGQAPAGLAVGEACVPGDLQCQGYCYKTSINLGVCSAGCAIRGSGCGVSGPSAGAEAYCLLADPITPSSARGDLGACAKLCNCTQDCSGTNAVCIAIADPGLATTLGTNGYCGPSGSGNELTTCQ